MRTYRCIFSRTPVWDLRKHRVVTVGGRRSSGLSLIELLATMAVVAILAGVAVPAFATLLRETRLTTAANDLLGTIVYVRSEAVKRGRRVTLCTSADGAACARNLGWQFGWIAYEDADGDCERDATEAILLVGARSATGPVIAGNTPVRDYISYVSSGVTQASNGALQMGTVTVCDGGFAREIIISASGRPRVVRDARC